MASNSNFNIEESIRLLEGDFYTEVIRRGSYTLLASRFKEDSYNFVIPSVPVDELALKQLGKDLKSHQEKGLQFSFYINVGLHQQYKTYLKENKLTLSYDDLYVVLHTDEQYELEKKEIIRLNDDSVEEFLKLTDICFPDWSNEDFTRWCLTSPNVEMLGVREDDQIVAFAAYYAKRDSDYVLLMNDGTHPDFRRKGLHHYLIKFRINEALKSKRSAMFYANVEKGSGSHNSYGRLGFNDADHFFVYPIKDQLDHLDQLNQLDS